MISPEYSYGGNGAVERHEYEVVRGEDAIKAAEEMALSIEALIENGYSLTTTHHSATSDRDGIERHAEIAYCEAEKFADDFWVYDEEAQGIQMYETGAASYEKHVKVHHYMYAHGPKSEEYGISFGTHLPYTDKPFVTTYIIEQFIGGGVNIVVIGDNIEAGDTLSAAGIFEREATAFDLCQFKKEYERAWQHVDAGQRERAVDESLKTPLL